MSRSRKATREDLLVELRNNDNEVAEETICEDVVRFEDWMIDANGKGGSSGRTGRGFERAWMFLSSSRFEGVYVRPRSSCLESPRCRARTCQR